MKRVLVDQDIAPITAIRDGLPERWEVSVGIPARGDDLIDALTGADVLVTTSRVKVTREVLGETSLEMIGKLGTGTDNIDLVAAAEYGVPVTYTPGYNAMSVAELALGLLLATARRFTEGRRCIAAGEWRDVMPLGTRVTGGTVGIVGLGNVGKRLAKLLGGFDVEVVYHDPYIPPIDGELVDATPTALEDLLAGSDFVCLTPELTEETRELIDTEALAQMKSTAILVNTSRGGVVDQAALVEALESGEIAGAGLDVFETEPPGSESPLLALDRVVVTPHVGGMTEADREKTISHLTANLHRLAQGEEVDEEFLATPSR